MDRKRLYASDDAAFPTNPLTREMMRARWRGYNRLQIPGAGKDEATLTAPVLIAGNFGLTEGGFLQACQIFPSQRR